MLSSDEDEEEKGGEMEEEDKEDEEQDRSDDDDESNSSKEQDGRDSSKEQDESDSSKEQAESDAQETVPLPKEGDGVYVLFATRQIEDGAQRRRDKGLWCHGEVKAVDGGASTSKAYVFDPTDSRKNSKLMAGASHVFFASDSTNYAIKFTASRYNERKVYKNKDNELAWMYTDDMSKGLGAKKKLTQQRWR